jgi:hypothetical protein
MDGQEGQLPKRRAKKSAPLDVVATLATLEKLKEQIREIEENLAIATAQDDEKKLNTKNQSQLVDLLLETLRLKNDAALSRLLEVEPPVISKIRHGRMPVGAAMLIRLHEESGLSIGAMKEYLKPIRKPKNRMKF